ncbi:MAG: TIGR03086 family metal-binding protein [Candidatus Saccharibacteria bacterium]
MDGAELFSRCLDQTTGVVKQVRPEQLANATPCADWHVWDLINYMLSELAAVAPLIAGVALESAGALEIDAETSADAESDIDLSEEWQKMADSAEAAVAEADPEGLAKPADGPLSNDDYLRRVATEILLYGWCLASAIGRPLTFDPGAAQAAYEYAAGAARRVPPPAGMAEPISVTATAPLQTKLLALYGHSPAWQSTS